MEARWVGLQKATEILGEPSPKALRKKFDRASKRTQDGGVEANVSGVRARKFGRMWKVQLSAAWTG
jgi:hypothetical protein